MGKVALVSNVTGVIEAGVGNNSFVQNMDEPKTIRMEGFGADDALNIVVQDFAGTGWEPWGVQLTASNRSCTPYENGVFAVESGEDGVDGTGTIYVEDGS